jgi:hypothetical protein
MGLESGTFINALVATNPVGSADPKSAGDDHIRLIKSTIKATFPNLTGAVTLTQAQINDAARLTASNVFTSATLSILNSGSVSVRVAGGSSTPGTTSFDMIQDGTNAYLWQRANLPLLIGTNSTTRITIAADGIASFASRPVVGATGGILSNANASNVGGSIIVTNVAPTDTTGMNPGDIKLVY